MSRNRTSYLLFAVVTMLLLAPSVSAQTVYAIEGYITESHLPGSFKVSGRKVLLTSSTSYGLMGTEYSSSDSPARTSLRVGAYVQVAGLDQGMLKPFFASIVRVRDDWNHKVSGIGVITRVVSLSPDEVYEADGYVVRITDSTNVSFSGDLGAMQDITENCWVHFSGKRGPGGIIVASRAQFFPGKPTKFKAAKNLELVPVKTRPVNVQANAANPASPGNSTDSAPAAADLQSDGADLQEDQQIKIGLGRWHTLPADQPLQQRVHRIGMTLVPEYQRKMPETDPSKIHFRFFAVDNPKLRTAVCLLDGVVLISSQLVERFSSDDEVAAVLADGIACNLQRQTARIVSENRVLLSGEIAADIAGAFMPGVGLVAAIGSGVSVRNVQAMEEQRLRIALSLMVDAGFDPWQAPEAWKLAAPKKLPKDLASLEYPDESCYQLNILSMQYRRAAAANN